MDEKEAREIWQYSFRDDKPDTPYGVIRRAKMDKVRYDGRIYSPEDIYELATAVANGTIGWPAKIFKIESASGRHVLLEALMLCKARSN